MRNKRSRSRVSSRNLYSYFLWLVCMLRPIFAFSRRIQRAVFISEERFCRGKICDRITRSISGTLTGNFPLESHAEYDETRRINERARSAYRSTRYSASLPQIQLRYRAISLASRRYRCSHATSPKELTRFSISLIFLPSSRNKLSC